MGAAEKAACDFFVESLEPSTACDALSFAASFAECGAHARDLQERCVGYAVDHFAECSEDSSFVELSSEDVAELIAIDDLACDEATVVAAVRSWFEHDAAGRARALKTLVPLIRWPLLPVVMQLSLWEESVLVRMMQHDGGGPALGLRLLWECSTQYGKSDAAAAFPRLKRCKGSVLPLVPLAFTALSQAHYAVTEDGVLLTSTGIAHHRPTLCSEAVMSSGQSCAEFTVVQKDQAMMIGVARPTMDANAIHAYESADFWGLHSSTAKLFHNSDDRVCQGQQGYAAGDVLRLLLDSDAGTLTVKKNGALLGVAVTQGLTGDLCWAVTSWNHGTSVRIGAVDPAEF